MRHSSGTPTAQVHRARRFLPQPHLSRLRSTWLGLVLAMSCLSCSLIETTVDLPLQAVKAILPGGTAVDPVDLQEELLRFADHFVASTSAAAEKLERDGKPIEHFELIQIKVKLASEILSMATGANAIGNLVDMVVLAGSARSRVEDFWQPKVYGDSAYPLVNVLKERERQIWQVAKDVLAPAQQAELKDAMEQWRMEHKNSTADDLDAFASLSLVNEVIKSSNKSRPSDSMLPSSVFALLDMDPLAGLDPATRELTETRLFAERALFIGQRMPQLIEWQMELMATRATSNPEVKKLVSGTTTLATAGDRISKSVEQFPQLISSEREKLLAAIRSEKQELADLSRQFSQTLGEGSRMAASTDQALNSFQKILSTLEKWPSSDPASPPFNIRDYAETASEIARMSAELRSTLAAVQPLFEPDNYAKLEAITDRLALNLRQQGDALIDRALLRAMLLVAVSCLLILLTALLYRYLSMRLLRKA